MYEYRIGIGERTVQEKYNGLEKASPVENKYIYVLFCKIPVGLDT